MNLTIALFIDALTQEDDKEDFIIKFRDIDYFKKLWSSYDFESKGWINSNQLCFLVTELPKSLLCHSPLIEENLQGNFEYIYNRKNEENKLLHQLCTNVVKSQNNLIETVVCNGEGYLIHYGQNKFIKETRALELLRAYKIDVYSGGKNILQRSE